MAISIPAEFDPIPSNYELSVHLFANGTETYVCNSTSVWNFVDAHAELYNNNDRNGKKVGVHDINDTPDSNGGFATWIADLDKSIVNAKVDILLPPTGNLNENNLPAAQLLVTSELGNGIMSAVKRILRLNANGLSPTRACNGMETETIAYTAEYLFYKEKNVTVSGGKRLAVSSLALILIALL